MRIWLLTILLLAGCSRSANEASAVVKSNPIDEQYAVYSVLLNEIHNSPEDGSQVKLIVINDQTSGDNVTKQSPEYIFQSYKVSLSPEFQAALKDYEAKNKEPQRLIGSFDLKVDYVLLNKKDFDAFFKGNSYWKDYYRKYPNSPGYITLSKVGFDPDMKHALVYVGIDCGGLCGDGSYRLLTKEDGVWKETKRLSFWAS
ncbi:MAG TPA: hypothetical protein VKB86_02045 [Pyrinomonadaceae bacterium]|nr:hypothetical protein [Pyrinomonadaceae bacterium]